MCCLDDTNFWYAIYQACQIIACMILWYVGATVTLQTPSDISTPEGNSGEMRTVMNLCVSLTNIMGGLDRDVVLRLTTVPLTAGNVAFMQ